MPSVEGGAADRERIAGRVGGSHAVRHVARLGVAADRAHAAEHGAAHAQLGRVGDEGRRDAAHAVVAREGDELALDLERGRLAERIEPQARAGVARRERDEDPWRAPRGDDDVGCDGAAADEVVLDRAFAEIEGEGVGVVGEWGAGAGIARAR